MNKPLRTRFIVADGAHARLVMRDHETGDFRTVRELHAHDRAAHAYSGGVIESATGHRNGTREPHEPARRQAQAFAREVATTFSEGDERLVIVAPARVAKAVEAALSQPARERLVGRIAKDLVKVADHDLARWFSPLEL